MKIFVTGGGGMVGKNIISLASQKGVEVLAPNRSELDLSSQQEITNLLSEYQPDIVIHCAGLVGGIQANIAQPYEFCYQNLKIGMNVIQAAKDSGIKKLINLGSSCMYPREANNPLSEELILTGKLEPTNEGYAIAKIAIARLAEYISKQYDVQYKTYIPCNLYGYWDKFDINKSHMIPAVIRKVHEAKATNSQIVDIWGDGLSRREFMFAEDLADFIFFSLDRFSQVPNFINVGIGSDYSINEYYEAIAIELGYEGQFKHDLNKPSGMKQKLVDTQLQTNLGWQPKTDLQTGIRKTYKHFLTEVI